jgi:hypothetical protein
MSVFLLINSDGTLFQVLHYLAFQQHSGINLLKVITESGDFDEDTMHGDFNEDTMHGIGTLLWT